MTSQPSLSRAGRVVALASLFASGALLAGTRAGAQVPQGAPPPPAPVQTARAAAPIDYTGYWVSVITEDWQWRFVTPIVGDYIGVPLNSAGDTTARAWNHDADVAAGEQCKPFGAAAIMRLPTRLQITWQDDTTMQLQWDLGTQSRTVHFDKAVANQPGARTYQGHAVGEWISTPAPGGRGGGGGGAAAGGRGGPAGPRPGGLRIVTTNLRDQHLRMNGVPVSENAVVTDYLDIVPSPDGHQWLVVKTIVDDPAYLSQPYITSAHFRKEPDGAKWSPSPCELLPRLKNTATQVPRAQGE